MHVSQLRFLVASEVISIEDALILLAKTQGPSKAMTLGERFVIERYGNQESRFYFRFTKQNVIKLFRLSGLESQYSLPNRITFSGIEGLCILLRRMAYPGRFCDLSVFFGRHPSVLCSIFWYMVDYFYKRFKSLLSLDCGLINLNRLEKYSTAVQSRGGALSNCVGFIDGT
ncbi:hypothetical protein AeMF1_003399 [Aphanomyces euteiches]|nr:hypothetical protein AeMF1_003399 [Aphanomyces euteiches]